MTIEIKRYPSAEVADGDVTLAKMAALTRGSVIVGGAADAPTALDAKTSGQLLVGDGTDLKSVAVSGDATLAANGALTVTSVGAPAADPIVLGNDVQTSPVAGLSFVLAIETPIGAAASINLVAPTNMRIVDVWGHHVLANGEAGDTVVVANGADPVASLDWSGTATTIARAAILDYDHAAFASGANITVTTTDSDAGDDVAPGLLYILAVRVTLP